MTLQSRADAARKELSQVRDELGKKLSQDKTRTRAPMVRLMHQITGMLSPGFRYASQAGQDQVIDMVFEGKTGGTFVDVGAYDGLTGSNTFYFEKFRDWTGVLVEPVERNRERAKSFRNSPILPYAVADKEGEATFIAVTEGFTQMSGLSDTYDAKLLTRVRADPRHQEEEITVKTTTLSAILTESGMPNPDFISLDIEGGEMPALRAFDFDSHRVTAWAIENNTGSPALNKLMVSKGYQLVEFCGSDEIYVLKDR